MRRRIYLACPWAPLGGGMFKVTDYLVQHQAHGADDADLCPLDTRGGGHVLGSLPRMVRALAWLSWERARGRLAGVHVNMAERASIVRKGLVVAWARLLGVPVLIHLHAAEIHHVYRSLAPRWQGLVRWLFSLADGVLVLGERSRAFVVDELHCDPARVQVVINGVPAASRERRTERPEEPFRILFIGNLTERKGVSDLLQALARMRTSRARWEATLAGGGDVDGFRRRAAGFGLGAETRLIGWARQDQVAALLAAADVLVLPSYDEGLPLVILEAMANGVAVVCTPVGEIPHTLRDGEHALFVTPGDVPGIAAALDRLVDEPALRRALEARGRAFHAADFSMQAFFMGVAAAHRKVFGVAAGFDPAGRSKGHGA